MQQFLLEQTKYVLLTSVFKVPRFKLISKNASQQRYRSLYVFFLSFVFRNCSIKTCFIFIEQDI